jgi:hypothetical protein
MDYNNIASSIRDLSRNLTNWSSPICNESNQLLDISSAAKGSNSTTPVGAINQPSKYPTGQRVGSFYRFDPALCTGRDSWEDLKRMLCQTGCVSGCRISTRQMRKESTSKKLSYTLACHQYHPYESRAVITFTPGTVGANNVIGQKMKRQKAKSRKGKIFHKLYCFHSQMY